MRQNTFDEWSYSCIDVLKSSEIEKTWNDITLAMFVLQKLAYSKDVQYQRKILEICMQEIIFKNKSKNPNKWRKCNSLHPLEEAISVFSILKRILIHFENMDYFSMDKEYFKQKNMSQFSEFDFQAEEIVALYKQKIKTN